MTITIRRNRNGVIVARASGAHAKILNGLLLDLVESQRHEVKPESAEVETDSMVIVGSELPGIPEARR